MPAVPLDDGRALAYEEHGDPAGVPVVLFHGAPGSRRFVPDEDVTRAHGVRLITFDRPGCGRSTRREGRSLLDSAADFVALLDALDLATVAVVGVSAGGPHALASAVAHPAAVTQLAVVSMPGPLDEVPDAWRLLGEKMRPTAEVARTDPARAVRAVVRYMQPVVDEPERSIGAGGPAPDRDVKRDPALRPMLVDDAREAFRQGATGLADDLVAFWRPWGFRIADVPLPVRVWHGAHDTRAEPDARYVAAALPRARLTVWPDAGHYGVLRHWHEVLHAIRQ